MAFMDFTLADVYRRNAQSLPDRTALVFEDQRINHRDYMGQTERLTVTLSREGVKAGERVAILSQNLLEMIDPIGAVSEHGAILLSVNFRLNANEIGDVLADGVPAPRVADPEYQEIVASLKGLLSSVRRYFDVGSYAALFVPYAELAACASPRPNGKPKADDGFVIHPAATGGGPHGTVLSRANLLTAQIALLRASALNERDVSLGVVPLLHIATLGLMLTMQQAGGMRVQRGGDCRRSWRRRRDAYRDVGWQQVGATDGLAFSL